MKERIRERAQMVKTELTGFSCRLATGDATVLTRTDRIIVIVSLLIGIFLFMFSMCYADGDIITAAGDKAKAYYDKLFGIVTFVAGLAAIICLIWIAASPTANGARTPLEWLKRILVSYACIMLLGGIFKLIKSLTEGQSTLP